MIGVHANEFLVEAKVLWSVKSVNKNKPNRCASIADTERLDNRTMDVFCLLNVMIWLYFITESSSAGNTELGEKGPAINVPLLQMNDISIIMPSALKNDAAK